MEGLIPIVFRAIKRTKTRSRYECLSSGAAQAYDVGDFRDRACLTPEIHRYAESGGKADDAATGRRFSTGHRRYNSTGDFMSSRDVHNFDGDIRQKQRQQQQLVRFRSHKMVSCITGET
ncbi:hypothetical protein SAY86_020019 [Trapa natans]|uniref:Uncharacterized protein n=1 Tax=Trapa natans TaxID=22666 RepID=A0AAN7LMS0_TRANT|nr:hypothetical protein SAY86_020019 [Trapa natans]